MGEPHSTQFDCSVLWGQFSKLFTAQCLDLCLELTELKPGF